MQLVRLSSVLFIFSIECSLTLVNLHTVLEGVEDWWRLAFWMNIPNAKLNEIDTTYQTDVEKKNAVLLVYLHQHPAPSWRGVAFVLYRMDSGQVEYHEQLKKLYSRGYITGNDIDISYIVMPNSINSMTW